MNSIRQYLGKKLAGFMVNRFYNPQFYFNESSGRWERINNREEVFPNRGGIMVNSDFSPPEWEQKFGKEPYICSMVYDNYKLSANEAVANKYIVEYKHDLDESTCEIFNFAQENTYQILDFEGSYERLESYRRSEDKMPLSEFVLVRCSNAKIYGPLAWHHNGSFLEFRSTARNIACFSETILREGKLRFLHPYSNDQEDIEFYIKDAHASLNAIAETQVAWTLPTFNADPLHNIRRSPKVAESSPAPSPVVASPVVAAAPAPQPEPKPIAPPPAALEPPKPARELPPLLTQLCEAFTKSHLTVHDKEQQAQLRALLESVADTKACMKHINRLFENYKAEERDQLSKELAEAQKDNARYIAGQKEVERLQQIYGTTDSASRAAVAAEQSLKSNKSELEITEKKLSKFRAEKTKLEKELGDQISTWKNSATSTAKAIDRTLTDIVMSELHGKESREGEFVKINSQQVLTQEQSAEELIDAVQSYLTQAGRKPTRNDVVNYLICISQSFITTFAGEPGTGKTSLCNLIARALGLTRGDEHNRFVELSVERGWSSHKDYIGYYNPLVNRLEVSNAKMMNAIQQLNTEICDKASNFAPYLVLLDEANLSPIEHYWSVFLRSCDSVSACERVINLGGPESYNIPEHLSFLATINFDHTTEALSPRFLDRSWVIMLDSEQFSELDAIMAPTPAPSEKMPCYEILKTHFSPQAESTKLKEEIDQVWQRIVSCYKTHKHSISPRNRLMIVRYVLVAQQYMQEGEQSYPLAALDYAFSQKILPLTDGYGQHYDQLMMDLDHICQDMPMSRKHIERMRAKAKEIGGYYQFFTRN